MTKTVSIVLPTYNGAQYLRQSIESCLKQTYPRIELLIVDDCSTDDTAHILHSYENDPRIKVIRHAVNAKLPAALNTGFANSSGAYLTWTSDDNEFLPDAIDRMVEYLEQHPDVGFVYTDYWLMDENGQIIRRISAGPPEHLRERCMISCFLYRREVYEVVGNYDPDLFRIEDYDYWLRVAQRFRLGWHPEPLYLYRRHSSSLTAVDPLEHRARMFDKVQTKFFGPDPNRRHRVLAQLYIAAAFESYFRMDRLGVVSYVTRAIRRDRSLLKNRGVLSIMVRSLVGNGVTNGLRWFVNRLLPANAASSRGR